ncbi:MAG: polysaccharide pyruvyl transferase family protein [Clostridia bacterium]|nr:polysaccharide pyruvyl transferase family protein [Clostridia bacterium]
MKKIGIVTFNDNNNYGNRLQNYATNVIYSKLGFRCETIENIANSKSAKYKIKHYMKLLFRKRYKHFIEFNRNIKFSSIKIDNCKKINNSIKNKLNKRYDYFIVGSDQVWNSNLKRFNKFQLLTFANPEKRIAFSASFGTNSIPDNNKQLFKQELDKFKRISVRENEGKDIVEDLIDKKDVQVLIDPTMMLSAKEWDKVAKKPSWYEGEKYILCYFLGDVPDERLKEIERIANENNYKIISLLDKKSIHFLSGPCEFLFLEKNAELICTDSFHSCVFSIIYDRPFVVFDRCDGNVSMNSRLDTLLSKFKLEDRKVTGKIYNELLQCDYSQAKEILEIEQKKSMNFLKEALDIEVKK